MRPASMASAIGDAAVRISPSTVRTTAGVAVRPCRTMAGPRTGSRSSASTDGRRERLAVRSGEGGCGMVAGYGPAEPPVNRANRSTFLPVCRWHPRATGRAGNLTRRNAVGTQRYPWRHRQRRSTPSIGNVLSNVLLSPYWSGSFLTAEFGNDRDAHAHRTLLFRWRYPGGARRPRRRDPAGGGAPWTWPAPGIGRGTRGPRPDDELLLLEPDRGTQYAPGRHRARLGRQGTGSRNPSSGARSEGARPRPGTHRQPASYGQAPQPDVHSVHLYGAPGVL